MLANSGNFGELMICPFCNFPDCEKTLVSSLSFAIRDKYAISPGHTLVLPRRHLGSFFDLTDEEQADLFTLASQCKKNLDVEFKPAGYNIGINDGRSAGQTIPHVHLHLIPRYEGDQEDPRGGIRLIFPEKAAYWENSGSSHE